MKIKITILLSILLMGGSFSSLKQASKDTVPTIHVVVALCDNKYQGIVPVPKKIGNGQDPDNNLYWGCGYGVRSYFKKSTEWKFIKSEKIDSIKLERLIFKHTSKNFYLVADAYNGKDIAKCTHDFFASCSGESKDNLKLNDAVLGLYGNAKLIAYIGHDGLMDFDLDGSYRSDGKKRDCIILACYSKRFFKPHLLETQANPLVWTSGLMCPEAYTLHDALSGYVNGEVAESVRTRAAKAYSKYQKCSEKAARNLLLTGY
ncbi:hypothetical protein CNR22_15010 [Sphingobacteriaceae bacterium]|nr:hypothetical protein CNR22_15010 [Sphingobacteriaceae bacterium]